VYGGDVGWSTVMQPVEVSLNLLLDVTRKSKAPGFFFQIILAGKMLLQRVIGDSNDLLLFLLDERGDAITINSAEYLWLAGCCEACGVELAPKDMKWVKEFVRRMLRKGEDP
jgi:hypothetical protein